MFGERQLDALIRAKDFAFSACGVSKDVPDSGVYIAVPQWRWLALNERHQRRKQSSWELGVRHSRSLVHTLSVVKAYVRES